MSFYAAGRYAPVAHAGAADRRRGSEAARPTPLSPCAAAEVVVALGLASDAAEPSSDGRKVTHDLVRDRPVVAVGRK